jgi:hypothetical protein
VTGGVLGGLEQEQLVGEGGEVVADAPIAEAVEVNVGVDQAGEEGGVGVVVRRCGVGRADGSGGADFQDAFVLDEDSAV